MVLSRSEASITGARTPFPASPQGIEERRGQWVATIKSLPTYNPLTVGAALRLEATGTPFNPAAYTGKIRSITRTGPSTVELKLDKARGELDANCVYGRRVNTGNFAFLGKFTAATATITLPGMPAGESQEWEFYTRGVIKDAEVGEPPAHVSEFVKG